VGRPSDNMVRTLELVSYSDQASLISCPPMFRYLGRGLFTTCRRSCEVFFSLLRHQHSCWRWLNKKKDLAYLAACEVVRFIYFILPPYVISTITGCRILCYTYADVLQVSTRSADESRAKDMRYQFSLLPPTTKKPQTVENPISSMHSMKKISRKSESKQAPGVGYV
jgi:hypothetical protein